MGNAWLVHPAAGPDRQSLLFAAGLAPDPEYALVVVDLPPGAPLDSVEEALARAVPAGPHGLRVVFGRTPARGAAPAGRRLARRLGRHVVVPDGVLRPSAGGTLFIGADRGRGWALCTPEGEVHHVSRRFPRPAWDAGLPGRPLPVGPAAVAEPVAAGVWLRPVREDAAQNRHRGLLAARLRCRADAPTVVIGAPGAPEPAAEDLARFWRNLPEGIAPRVLAYGSGRGLGTPPLGRRLAALTGEAVHVYNGFPAGDPLVGRGLSDEVLFLAPDGTPGRPVRAREFLHLPPEPEGPPHPAFATDHRWPLDHLPMLRQGLHHGGSGAVLEVLPWGLWIRPSAEPADADAVRGAPAHPGHELILCDDGVPPLLPRLRQLADDVLGRLSSRGGPPVRVVSAGRPWRPAAGIPRPRVPAAAPALAAPALAALAPPAAGQGPGLPAAPPAGRPGPAPGSPADAAVVDLALRREPGLGGVLPPETVRAGLAAVRTRFTVRARPGGEESGRAHASAPPTADPPAPAALALLPAYAGVVALRADLAPEAVQRYREHGFATAYDVCAASLTGTPGRPGNTDILIRSTTGRRTALLEPEQPDRVLFPPGTRFEVLQVRARPDGRAVVLMGELPPAGFCGAGATGEAALRELVAALRIWRQDEESGMVRGPARDPFATPPTPDGPGALSGAGGADGQEGAGGRAGPTGPTGATGSTAPVGPAAVSDRPVAGGRPVALSGRFR
ncbi:hypothetical protein [Streptomyces sp. NPDC008125]|uniref:hypothetical protein n=1 Tax=Streptomyces sp. NPDC008125 TaxID=3364811 RepID=UPI0036E3A001